MQDARSLGVKILIVHFSCAPQSAKAANGMLDCIDRIDVDIIDIDNYHEQTGQASHVSGHIASRISMIK